MVNPISHYAFNLALARVAQLGYARTVSFNTLAGAPLQPTALVGSLEGGRVGRSLKPETIAARADKARREHKRRSPAFFQQAKAQLVLWPTKES